MCGLVGAIGTLYKKDEEMFQDMLVMDVVRGPHSTGVIAADHAGKWAYAKSALMPHDFFQLKAYKDAMVGINALLMGHNRWATIGKINTANAHPFDHGGIVGMHNGTLIRWRESLKDVRNFDVDSDALIYNIDEFGVHDTLPNVDGAWALAWYDKEAKTLNLKRNDQRPLYFAYRQDKKAMFYASEPWMITAAAGRRGVHINKVHEFPVLEWWRWDIPEQDKELGKAKVEKVKAFVPAPVGNYNGYNYSGQGQRQQYWDGKPDGNLDELRERAKVYERQRNKDVLFSITRYVPSDYARGTGYLEGLTYKELTGEEIEVRVYMPKKDFDELDEFSEYDFIGKAHSVVTPWIVKGEIVDGWIIMKAEDIDVTSSAAGHSGGNASGSPATDDNVLYLPNLQGKPSCRGPDGKEITQLEFSELTQDGCALCNCAIFPDDLVAWTWNNDPICQECFNDGYDEETAEQGAQQ